MSGRERRTSPRKECVVPLRFRVVSNGHRALAEDIAASYGRGIPRCWLTWHFGRRSSEYFGTRNLFHFARKTACGRTAGNVFTLLRELTGRGPELVHCSARVVHVDEATDPRGARGIGATVERFEPVVVARNWAN